MSEERNIILDSQKISEFFNKKFSENELSRAIEVYKILRNEFKLDEEIATAGLINELFGQDKELNEQAKHLADKLGITEIIIGIAKIERQPTPKDAKQLDKYIKLLLTISTDPRAIFLRIAHYLYLLRNLRHFSPKEQEEIVLQIENIYGTIAHRLGLYKAKTEFDELTLRYRHKQDYYMIADKLKATKSAREAYISAFIKNIKKLVDPLGYNYTVKGRPKSIASIWRKMTSQSVAFENIYDLFAIRIITDIPRKEAEEIFNKDNKYKEKVIKAVSKNLQPDEKYTHDELMSQLEKIINKKTHPATPIQKKLAEEADKQIELIWRQLEHKACWDIYSVIVDKYEPNPKRLRDWISNPKSNGYESLHITVVGPESRWVEIQIRTERMDQIAEYGLAAHWAYKEQGETGMNKDSVFGQLRNALQNPVETSNSEVKKQLYSDEIFVFTPKGDIIRLPKDSIVLDFAFTIHSAIGAKCIGAIVNNAFVSYKHKLSNGDKIKIVTSNRQKPKKEWLELVKTTNAKKKIKQMLNKLEYELMKEGREILQRKLKKLNISYSDENINKLMKKYGYDRKGAFLHDIAQGKVDLSKIKQYLEPEKYEEEDLLITENTSAVSSDDNVLVIDKNVDGIVYNFAKCCNPIPGDDIFAFVTATRGATIHRLDCPNADFIMSNYPYRVLPARWKAEIQEDFTRPVTILITGTDRVGMANAITEIVNKELKLKLTSISLKSGKNDTFRGILVVNIPNRQKLDTLIKRLKTIEGVTRAFRIK